MENKIDQNHLVFHYSEIMTVYILPDSSLSISIYSPHQICNLEAAPNCITLFIYLPHPKYAEIPGPRIEPIPQQ